MRDSTSDHSQSPFPRCIVHGEISPLRPHTVSHQVNHGGVKKAPTHTSPRRLQNLSRDTEVTGTVRFCLVSRVKSGNFCTLSKLKLTSPYHGRFEKRHLLNYTIPWPYLLHSHSHIFLFSLSLKHFAPTDLDLPLKDFPTVSSETVLVWSTLFVRPSCIFPCLVWFPVVHPVIDLSVRCAYPTK
jgi:hypothetical protein